MSNMNFVNPKAKIGADVSISHFSFIDEDVEIGDGSWIGPNVTVFSGARIGKNCKSSTRFSVTHDWSDRSAHGRTSHP